MDDSVRTCIEARVNFFGQYYSVPQELQAETDFFISELNNMGENCADSVEFESKFVSLGFSERFNALISRCTPMPYKMSKEEKKHPVLLPKRFSMKIKAE